MRSMPGAHSGGSSAGASGSGAEVPLSWRSGPTYPISSCTSKGLGHNSPRYIHAVTEALKLAFADSNEIQQVLIAEPDLGYRGSR